MEPELFSAVTDSNTEGTYNFYNEGHTLGNSLRYFLIKK